MTNQLQLGILNHQKIRKKCKIKATKISNVDLKFLRNEAEYFCIQGLVKVVDEEIEKTEKREAFRVEQLKRIDKNVTKIGSNEALRLKQMKRIDENMEELGSTVQTVVRGRYKGEKLIQVAQYQD